MKRFAALFDVHWGYERKGGHKVPLHDPKAVNATLDFLRDFKPHHIILGGDILDCGPVSHHNRHKPGATEGLKVLADAKELREALIEPCEEIASERLIYHIGNHEDWLSQVTDEMPGLEGVLDVRSLLKLGKRWEVVPQGGHTILDKLTFIHGDQLSSTEQCAKNAVIAYERNVRFGHFHTYQAYTKTSVVDQKLGRTGIAVPCLCGKSPNYGKGKPNRWVQGFNWGYTSPNGPFADYVSIITNGTFVANGKQYGGK